MEKVIAFLQKKKRVKQGQVKKSGRDHCRKPLRDVVWSHDTVINNGEIRTKNKLKVNTKEGQEIYIKIN